MLHSHVVEPKTRCSTLMCVNLTLSNNDQKCSLMLYIPYIDISCLLFSNYPYQQYPVRYPYEIFRARARQDDRPPVNPEKYDSLGPPGGDAARNSSFDFFKKFGQPIGKPNFKRTLMLNDRFDHSLFQT